MTIPPQFSRGSPGPSLSPGYASLFPAGVVAAQMDTPGDVSLIAPLEASAVAKAVPKRIGEFAAGRLCARLALAELGVSNFPLLAAPDRQPLWPERIVGSITHTEGICAAVAAESSVFRGLGLDTERAARVKPDLWPRIFTEAERGWLESLERGTQAAAATLIFSAKEAAYKCQYPVTGERLGFCDLEVTVADWGCERGGLAFAATRPIKLSDLGAPRSGALMLQGAYRQHDEFVSTSAFLPAV
jgi:4'-phosphopantetheinyl transferase EntD